MVNKADDLVLYAVGDVAPYREDPSSIFQRVAATLGQADIAFCQLEINLTHRGTPLPQARLAMRADPITAQAIKEAGFNIVSFASNHCMDWGREAFFDTINALREQGLTVIGVGSNIEEARKPAFVECKGTRIAFLAYNTILPQGYWAEINRPGCAPMRGFTLYEQIEHDQPGTPSRTHTFPHKDDLKAMVNDIRQAKSQADLVILSMHWGIHFIPAVIADYQREVTRVAIDAGADLILGHHAHILKGIEVYAGKVIFYSLCNFALDLSPTKEILESPGHKEISVLNVNWQPDPEYPTYFLPPDSRKTMIAKCVISNKEIKSVSFLPTYINKQSQPEILSSQDERFDEVVGYMEEITRDQGLNAKYVIEGDEVLIQEA
ncbi:MAG TPA: CapA family protein [Dehalococcoidia bacterium]|nr:CapA family protein [Dehalococcoidia bacterium]